MFGFDFGGSDEMGTITQMVALLKAFIEALAPLFALFGGEQTAETDAQ